MELIFSSFFFIVQSLKICFDHLFSLRSLVCVLKFHSIDGEIKLLENALSLVIKDTRKASSTVSTNSCVVCAQAHLSSSPAAHRIAISLQLTLVCSPLISSQVVWRFDGYDALWLFVELLGKKSSWRWMKINLSGIHSRVERAFGFVLNILSLWASLSPTRVEVDWRCGWRKLRTEAANIFSFLISTTVVTILWMVIWQSH